MCWCHSIFCCLFGFLFHSLRINNFFICCLSFFFFSIFIVARVHSGWNDQIKLKRTLERHGDETRWKSWTDRESESQKQVNEWKKMKESQLPNPFLLPTANSLSIINHRQASTCTHSRHIHAHDVEASEKKIAWNSETPPIFDENGEQWTNRMQQDTHVTEFKNNASHVMDWN